MDSDWTIVAGYLAAMIGLSWYLGRSQSDAKDYYLGGNSLNWWSVGISTMATQCSTNSLLGAPAFVITTGLLWLQYEFALPLAMVFIMIFLLPFYRKLNLVSVYAYQERRFGRSADPAVHHLQLLRAFATGVTVYGISIVLQSIVGIPFAMSVIISGVITVIYDMLGGMAAVVVSDVIQMVILYLGIALCIVYSIAEVGGVAEVFEQFVGLGEVIQSDQFVGLQAVDFSRLWAHRRDAVWLLADATRGTVSLHLLLRDRPNPGTTGTLIEDAGRHQSVSDAEWNDALSIGPDLLFSGCVYRRIHCEKPRSFSQLVEEGSNKPNYNLAVPKFVTEILPNGIIGLVMVALFSAAMSSLDSTINSLSAATIKDLWEPFVQKGPIPEEKQLLLSRSLTVFWGALIVFLLFRRGYFQVGDRIGEQGRIARQWPDSRHVPSGDSHPCRQ